MKRILVLLTLTMIILLMGCSETEYSQETETLAIVDEDTEYDDEDENDDEDYEETRRYTSQGTPYVDDDGENLYQSILPVYVDSSAIEAIGYSEDEEVLLVEFIDSGSYLYYGVPYSTYDDFLTADSKGQYYNSNIKGQYDCEKVN